MAFYYLYEIKEVIFYGINEYSLRMKDTVLSSGKKILAFIDRRADEIREIDGIPVCTKIVPNKLDECLIIALQNALQHDEIAARANKRGFERIVYVPMDCRLDQGKAQVVRNAYNCITLDDWGAEQRPIPTYGELYKNVFLGNSAVEESIHHRGKYITVKIPVDLVYTSLREGEYADIPLASFQPYDQMYDFFEANSSNDDSINEIYLRKYGLKDTSGAVDIGKTITMRTGLIEKYTEFFQEGLEFSLSCAPLAKWNERGYFNLCEGQHRTMWLLKRGIYYLPVRVPVDDWNKYANVKIAKEMTGLVDDIKLITPILNPCFENNSFYNKFFLIKLLVELQKKCYPLIRNRNILSFDSFYGYFSFNFCRMNAMRVMNYVEDEKLMSIYEGIKKLYNIELELTRNMKECFDEFDLVSFLGTFDQLNKLEVIKEFLSKKKVVISNLSIDEESRLGNEYIKNEVGKIFFENRMEPVYVLGI